MSRTYSPAEAGGPGTVQAQIIKFEEFELDLGRYELRRQGRPLKLEKVPMELLILLAEREGQLVTREEIVQRLWGADVFVDTRQGINTAVRKIRLALKDDPDNPRILQTVFGKGYRLRAPVVMAEQAAQLSPGGVPATPDSTAVAYLADDTREGDRRSSPEAPEASSEVEAGPDSGEAKAAVVEPRMARALFLIIQMGYLVLYGAALVYFPGIGRLGLPSMMSSFTLVAAAIGAAARLYLISAVAFNYRGSGRLFRQMFPGLLVLDALWAASPLFLFERWGELTLLGVAALAFLPFSQRTLILSAYPDGH